MPKQPRLKARADVLRARKRETFETTDWLGLWGLSLGVCAVVLAAIADFVGHDSVGAAFILVGAASIVALILQAGTEPVDRG